MNLLDLRWILAWLYSVVSLAFGRNSGSDTRVGTTNHRNADGFRSIHETDGQSTPLPHHAKASCSSPSSQDSDGPCDSPDRPNRLNRFAFKQPQSKPRPTPSTSFQSSRTQTTTDLFNPESHYWHTKEELRRLSRCVVCDMEWTTKKTVTVKLDHIQKCGMKNAFTDDAIRNRIIQELSKPLQVETTARTTEDPESPEKVGTLMENILKDTQPKKRGKRKEITTTVVKIQHRHGIFRARAEALLAVAQNENQEIESQLSNTSKMSTANYSKASPPVHEYPASKLGTKADCSPVLDDWLEPTDISRCGDVGQTGLLVYIPSHID